MKTTYVFHSCFVVETKRCCVVVDFRNSGSNAMKVIDKVLSSDKPVYVLCSHSHSDHFDNDILTWKVRQPNIKYVFSDELLASGLVNPDDAVFLKKLETYSDNNITIRAFGSTDIGCSFLLECDGMNIFHAGDLNNWHWNEEAPKSEALMYENNYLCELELLAEYVNHIHLAMFPVDSRLGKDYTRGAEQFVSRIGVDYFLPMHFWEKYDEANAFGDFAKQHGCTFLKLEHQGQSYEV